jgi:hypothetical protein
MDCILLSRILLTCRIGGNDVVGVFIVDKTGEVVAGTYLRFPSLLPLKLKLDCSEGGRE